MYDTVRLVEERGLFARKGTQTRLAEHFGVTRQHIYQLLGKIRKEASNG